jgi:hypothetical protein
MARGALTHDEAMELIRSLIEVIVLVPDHGSLRIEVRGELAAILAFGEGREKPGRMDRDIAKQIKMVAGARSSHTHRLPPLVVRLPLSNGRKRRS